MTIQVFFDPGLCWTMTLTGIISAVPREFTKFSLFPCFKEDVPKMFSLGFIFITTLVLVASKDYHLHTFLPKFLSFEKNNRLYYLMNAGSNSGNVISGQWRSTSSIRRSKFQVKRSFQLFWNTLYRDFYQNYSYNPVRCF